MAELGILADLARACGLSSYARLQLRWADELHVSYISRSLSSGIAQHAALAAAFDVVVHVRTHMPKSELKSC